MIQDALKDPGIILGEGIYLQRILMGTAETGRGSIFYYLLSGGGQPGRESYGVLVEYLGEQTAICNLSSSKEEMQSLLACMQRGTVTPVSVMDVVEDWIL